MQVRLALRRAGRDEDDAVTLDRRVTADTVMRHGADMAGNDGAAAVAVVAPAVIGALDLAADDLAGRQFDQPVRAAVEERGYALSRPEQHHRRSVKQDTLWPAFDVRRQRHRLPEIPAGVAVLAHSSNLPSSGMPT